MENIKPSAAQLADELAARNASEEADKMASNHSLQAFCLRGGSFITANIAS